MGDKATERLNPPASWGLPPEAIADLGSRLHQCWERFSSCFKTKTRDAAGPAWICLQGLLLMRTGRNFANIDRRVTSPDEDGQGLQQFMSDSPWLAQSPIRQVQREISATPALQHGGVVLLDESSDEKAGDKSAGAGRPHNGRLGKVEMSQTGVFLAFYKDVVWTWVDGELFLPEHWFTPDMADERKRVGVPPSASLPPRSNWAGGCFSARRPMACRLRRWRAMICMVGVAGCATRWMRRASSTWLKCLKTPWSI